jgi:hypothetical protein
MRKRYERCTLFMVTILAAVWAVSQWQWPWSASGQSERVLLFAANDPETVFALGLKLSLGCADVWSLELIPAVSAKVVQRVVSQRTEILQHARNETPEKALMRVFGVGNTTARHLLGYVSLIDSCSSVEPQRDFFTVED